MKSAALRLGFVLVSACFLASCGMTRMLGLKSEGGGGDLSAVGASTMMLPLAFDHVVYSLNDASESYWMSSVPLEDLASGKVRDGVVAHIQLLWRPYPGKTPTGASALNLAVRVLVISSGQLGLYSGGGFGDPSGDAGEELVELVVMGSSVTLVAKTAGFTDLLSPGAFNADVAARLAPEDSVRFRRAAAQLMTDTLEAPRWVGAQRPEGFASAAAWFEGMVNSPAAAGPTSPLVQVR